VISAASLKFEVLVPMLQQPFHYWVGRLRDRIAVGNAACRYVGGHRSCQHLSGISNSIEHASSIFRRLWFQDSEGRRNAILR
jgi:hypothetical protein